MKYTRVLLVFLAGCALLPIATLAAPADRLERTPPPLLLAPTDDRPLEDPSTLAERSRRVEISRNLIQAIDPAQNPTVLLDLFDGENVVARFERVETPRAGSRIWVGRIDGDPLSRVFLTVRGSAALLHVNSPVHGVYEVMPLPVGRTGNVLRKIDTTRFEACDAEEHGAEAGTCSGGHAAAPPETSATASGSSRLEPRNTGQGSAGLSGGKGGSTCSEDGSTIEVLIVYTDDAATANGGTAGIEALADAAVVAANDAYANSQITPRLRLVGVHRALGYQESNSAEVNLCRLETRFDGFLDDVPPIRDALGADVVSLFVDDLFLSDGKARFSIEPGVGGPIAFPERAFNVVEDGAAVNNLTFAHEVGHNQGSRHDWVADPSAGVFEYSHGYTASTFRTIMSIQTSRPRVAHFSNPNVLFNGAPTGVTGPTNQPTDNARSINETAVLVSSFRCCDNRDAQGDCVLPTCPGSYDCGPDCQPQFPFQCDTNPFGQDACKKGTGEFQGCARGIGIKKCDCTSGVPGAFCLNQDQALVCLPYTTVPVCE
ncbi:hypothetical protein ABI59_22170 [Acidobacteria bacterium Mor1]|nr:hypothetical protein ABI59_22170 [Acidobacteria bacterium Mor1]